MCQYCAEDHGFWDSIIERGQREIRILDAAEVAEVERQLADRGSVSWAEVEKNAGRSLADHTASAVELEV